jgi:[acyl-carrier-protein] S-malonyltransferase
MAEAQETFSQAVEQAPIISPVMPIVGNVAASPLSTPFEIRTDLEAQLTARVRWTESIKWMISQGITTFIELGSGSVLTGLLRRIDREAVGLSLNSPEDFDQFAARV